MASLQWDRLLETCCRRNATDILLCPGTSPMIRLTQSWRWLQVPPVDAATIQALASERIEEHTAAHEAGYCYADFNYGDTARFRAIAFGYPATNALLISRHPDNEPGGDHQTAEAL